LSDTRSQQFLDRVFPHVAELNQDRFSSKTWKFEKRPTNEGLGMIPRLTIDVENLVARILDVEAYPSNVKYVADCQILERESETSFTYVQHMSLPLLGKVQSAMDIADFGEQDGFRLVAWNQNRSATDALNKKQGFRTEYNLGAWLIKPDSVAFALSSCPRKSDVGGLKFAIMTRGADATAGEVLRQNIAGMTDWAARH
jgi:hypothetical protein